MKKIIISAAVLLFFLTIAKAEAKNKILYDNRVFDLCCNLLDPQYVKASDSDWFNYGSVWEIKENTLYLLGIDNNLPSGYKKADMKELFGDKYINGKVKAEWFTGEIRIPDGKVFLRINNEYTFERDNILYVEEGEIYKKIVIANTIKKETDKIRSMLTPIIDPDKSLFGISYGTGEEEFIARFGKPMRIHESGKSGREMLYGKKYIFMFEKTKLIGIKTVSSEHEVYKVMPTHSSFDLLEWQLSNGITQNMNLAEVKKILKNEGLTAKEVIISLPGKTLDITQQVINLPIEAVKKITQAFTPFKKRAKPGKKVVQPIAQDTAKVSSGKPGLYGSVYTAQQKVINTTAVQPETDKTSDSPVSVPAQGLELAAGLPEKTVTITQKIINLPIEAVKKVAKAVTPSKSSDNDQGELTDEKGLQYSFSTKKARIAIRFRREAKRDNIDEVYTVSEILVRRK